MTITWNAKQVQQWISSLEDGRYIKYIDQFKTISGVLLRYITRMELMYRIKDDNDREDLEKHIISLFPFENKKILYPFESREDMIDSQIESIVDTLVLY